MFRVSKDKELQILSYREVYHSPLMVSLLFLNMSFFFLSLIVLLFRFEYDIFRDLKFLCRFLIRISGWWILHSVMGMGFCWLPLLLDEDTATDVDLEHRLSLKICLG